MLWARLYAVVQYIGKVGTMFAKKLAKHQFWLSYCYY